MSEPMQPSGDPSSRRDSMNVRPMVNEDQIQGDMSTEEPDGWDQAPLDIHDENQKRHPRPDGRGGVGHKRGSH